MNEFQIMLDGVCYAECDNLEFASEVAAWLVCFGKFNVSIQRKSQVIINQ